MTSAEVIRILLCEDHTVVRSGLRRVLEEHSDLVVVAETGTAATAVERAQELYPDVAVMDIGLPDANGIDATRQIREVSAGTAVLVLTMHDDVGYLQRAFKAGAKGYLVKDAADTDLVTAVRTLAAGGEHVHPRLGAALMRPEPSAAMLGGPGGDLSDREIEVLQLIAFGLTNAEIAERLYVSVRTVESHRSHINHKLNLHTRAELVSVARDAGLLIDDNLQGPP